jgi:23S rRNA (uracil1939-C5)-methyltransferase
MIPQGCVESCPGCRHRALSPEESALRKTAWLGRNLEPWAPVLLPLRAPGRRWGYRRKALLHARFESGEWRFGLIRREGRDEFLVPIPGCPLHAPELNERLMVLRTLIPEGLPLVFVQATGTILTLVVKCPRSETVLAWARTLEEPLRARGVQSLQLNWNPAAGRRALSSRHQEPVFGPSLAQEGGLFHGAQSFRQQIPELEGEALGAAEAFLAHAGVPVAVDLYSGAGASLARWLARGWSAAGVELVGEACVAAARNAPGALTLKGRTDQRIPQLDAFLAARPFVLYTNPPRMGHDEATLAWILRAAPRRIAYLSCNPKSLARDLASLAGSPAGRYRVERLLPFDFFPQTDHVECLALLCGNG